MPKAGQLLHALQNGQYDGRLAGVYGEKESVLERERKRYVRTIGTFIEMYGEDRSISVYSAPGRCEIGGNHTDHNNGLVLAAAVSLDIIAVVAKNNEETLRVTSEGFGRTDVVALQKLGAEEAERGKSSALLRGIAAGFRRQGASVGGFDAYTTSQVLRGSGLSSSAAFEMCMAAVLNGEYNQGTFSPTSLAHIGQEAENNYFGKPSGLMDQLASAVGGVVVIDFENAAAPQLTPLQFGLTAHGHVLVVTDTKGSHANLTGEYAAVRSEMHTVAHAFGKETLREVPQPDFLCKIGDLRKDAGDRAILRALHFYTECERVRLMQAAIQSGDFTLFLNLVKEAGHSAFEYNQNAYSPQNPREQGVPLGLALSSLVLGGQGAYRLQGGGFGGAIQAFVPQDRLDLYIQTMEDVFGEKACHVLDFRQKGCLRVLP